tara:strand:+ start:4803 stop:5138 length:336 start_codon:yes stop_codon:yes gene_type:complete
MMAEICSMCYKQIDEHKDGNGKVYWTQGHNAQPLVADDTGDASMLDHARCCDSCNDLVLEVRIMQAFGWQSVPQKVIGWFKDAKTASDMMMAHMRLTQLIQTLAEQTKEGV